MKKLVIGILAHVDAGKTTLSESMLYLSGSIKKLGRVDYGDAFLDTFDLERSRGITIFSKQAELTFGETQVSLLDTPGHIDFSAEMERTLQVLDVAILVISGADGVQGHTQTLWRLLARYKIPVFLFVNKMDQLGTDREVLLKDLQKSLDEHCVDFSEEGMENPRIDNEFLEALAMCEESALEEYLESGDIEKNKIRDMIAQRKVFPCYFGSALKIQGVEAFMKGIDTYTKETLYKEEFGAKVFKIARDEQGNRLSYMKITGGNLGVKQLLTNQVEDMIVENPKKSQEIWEEKVNQIRIYSGAKYETVSEVSAGTICAVTGLSQTYQGQGLGIEAGSESPVLEPVLTYQIQLPQDCDVNAMLLKLRQLEEEEPQLHIVWDERLNEIQAKIMGEVQIEILKSLIAQRFGVMVEFGAGHIVYKETIKETVIGMGHFEPLRHYAEVHLRLEPLPIGSGLEFATDCSEDVLDRNWQRLILTHLEEKEHKGVLTGSAITDMRITLVMGRAHLKHTEGGDFRQATYRALRQGLRQAKCRLLEPFYEVTMELPSEMIGRALSDIEKMNGTFIPPEFTEEIAVLKGSVPVASMGDYQMEFLSYTKGKGRLSCTLKGYYPCHNQEEVIASTDYVPESDLDNPTGSVFCAHGAGFEVPWDQVKNYMHMDSSWANNRVEEDTVLEVSNQKNKKSYISYDISYEDEKELQEIFSRTFKSKEPRISTYRKKVSVQHPEVRHTPYKKKVTGEEYLLVDGYNIIYAIEELKELAEVNIDGARNKLMDLLCNYQGFKKCHVILVFDAYRVIGHDTEITSYHNIHVVYTKEAETADQYIEKVAHEIGRKYEVTVATSDGLEQIIVRGQGCNLLSARGLLEEMELANRQMRSEYLEKQKKSRNYLFDHLPEEMIEHVEEVRLGKKEWNDHLKE